MMVTWRRHLRCMAKGGGSRRLRGGQKKKKEKKKPPKGEGVPAPCELEFEGEAVDCEPGFEAYEAASAAAGDDGDMTAPPPVPGQGGRESPPVGGEKKKQKKKKRPPKGEGVPAPSVSALQVPSAEPDRGGPEESAGVPIGPDKRLAAHAWDGPHICSTCGYGINGGEVLCSAPGCDGVAKGALQCRSCFKPVAPNDTYASTHCWKDGGGSASPPDWDNPGAMEVQSRRRDAQRRVCLLRLRRRSATGLYPCTTGRGGAWDGPWRTGHPAWAQLFQAVNVGDTATVDSILSRGDVDVNTAVSGLTPLLLAAVHNYGAVPPAGGSGQIPCDPVGNSAWFGAGARRRVPTSVSHRPYSSSAVK